MKTKHSDRKMTVDEYLVLRVDFLENERNIWVELRILTVDADGNQTLQKQLLINADEVPFALQAKARKQISAQGERVQLQTPPIVGDDKYRDGTYIPFITGVGTLLFICVILKGGNRIRARELPALNRIYGKYLLICCNAKGYMYVFICFYRFFLFFFVLLFLIDFV